MSIFAPQATTPRHLFSGLGLLGLACALFVGHAGCVSPQSASATPERAHEESPSAPAQTQAPTEASPAAGLPASSLPAAPEGTKPTIIDLSRPPAPSNEMLTAQYTRRGQAVFETGLSPDFRVAHPEAQVLELTVNERGFQFVVYDYRYDVLVRAFATDFRESKDRVALSFANGTRGQQHLDGIKADSTRGVSWQFADVAGRDTFEIDENLRVSEAGVARLHMFKELAPDLSHALGVAARLNSFGKMTSLMLDRAGQSVTRIEKVVDYGLCRAKGVDCDTSLLKR